MPSVLITGCSSGFGELTAITFADHGHRVFATMRTPGKSVALNERPDIEQLALDVGSSSSVDAAVSETISRVGRLDIVVNNAGVEVFGPVHLLSDDEVTHQLDTNVLGVVRMVRAVVPHFLANGGGTIVNVGSVAGFVGTPYSGIYAASKHAIEAISESLHFELSHRGVKVRVVEPGQFATELGNNSIHAKALIEGTEEYQRWQRFRSAMRSLAGGEPARAQVVADAIYAAAVDEPGRLRHLVGVDTDLIIGAKSSMTFEDFDLTMRATLDWHD